MFYSQPPTQSKDTDVKSSLATSNELCEYNPNEKMDDKYAQYVQWLLSNNSHDFSKVNDAEGKQDSEGRL